MAIDSINSMVDPLIAQAGAQQAVTPNRRDPAISTEKVNPTQGAERTAADNNRANRNEAGTEPAAPVTREQLEPVIEQLNELIRDSQRSLSFRVDDDLDKLVVSVVNPETDEIIRQMPSEESLKFAKSLEGVMGIIFNERA